MSTDQIAISSLLIILLGLFVWGRIRYDIVAAGGLVVAVVLGLVPAEQAFYGFGHPAVITVAGVLIMSRALSLSGAVDGIARWIRSASGTETGQIGVLSVVAAGMSGFMNNVGALALLLPAAIESCKRAGRPVRLVLMPLAFASILGGMVTLIGTPPNILIATYRQDAIGQGFDMFDFAWVGLPVALLGVAFIALVGWRLIPSATDKSEGAGEAFDLDAYLSELAVPKSSAAHGKTLSEIEELTEDLDVAIVGLVRRKRHYPRPPQHEPLQGTDRLLVEAGPEDLDRFVDRLGLRVAGSRPDKESLAKGEHAVLTEAVVTPGSRIAGRTVGALRLKGRYNLTLLGISRQGHTRGGRLSSFLVRPGDVLLVQGLENDVPDALNRLGCLPLASRDISHGLRGRGMAAAGIFAAAVGLAALGLLPIAVCFVAAVIAVVVLGILPVRDLYANVDMPVIVLLAALLPVGQALETTGMTGLIAGGITDVTQGAPAFVVVTILLLAAMFMSDLLNNAATVVVMAPIAVQVARSLDASPDPFLMAVAVGASCAFLTPIGHQNNALVMGPGGYKFGDYWRLGLPLEVLIAVVSVPLIMLAWPP